MLVGRNEELSSGMGIIVLLGDIRKDILSLSEMLERLPEDMESDEVGSNALISDILYIEWERLQKIEDAITGRQKGFCDLFKGKED